ncbi:hypothetical protein [Rhodococcus tibetensis]|uniref:Integrase n=1 Tax=Rhodococcus tibetensis TaxID=2965064 RepID=A0ABT1Q9J5_9NOCA|nr:hypothetical protein [Rhodococcus sp. FXJ9.536]MCQ4118939.1 hypothetical protein [Rhodococcus sp. FXJ9.536]
MSLSTESPPPSSGNSPAVARRYAHDWTLFADWCDACEHRALPANPSVLAEFLADHPAANGTQRRRVTAINTVHSEVSFRRRGEPRRSANSSTRPGWTACSESRTAAERIPRIPVEGWPAGLFGRRDALILALVAAGLNFEQIASLRHTHVTAESDALAISTGGEWMRVPSPVTDRTTPVAVIDRPVHCEHRARPPHRIGTRPQRRLGF